MSAVCEKCGAAARGRFCDEHRIEHGMKLARQLAALIADHNASEEER
jgi:hypothetical protein